MRDEKGKRKHSKGIFQNYLIYILSFLVIALAVTAGGIFIANKPVTELVHKLENRFSMEVRDIQIGDSYYNLNESDDKSDADFGDKIGNVSIDNCGLNCGVYYGSNRVSMRYGAGFQSDSGVFGSGKISVIKGCDETYFSNLKYADVGDIITVHTNDGVYKYRVTEAKYMNTGTQPYQTDDRDMLVLCSVFSDFSEHSGEYLCVFADRIEGEGN